MILKILDYRKSEESSAVYDEWNYFDNIASASCYADEATNMATVRCSFKDGSIVTFAVPYVAYLMSDTGKTIEKIYTAEEEKSNETIYKTLQDAAAAAMEKSIS